MRPFCMTQNGVPVPFAKRQALRRPPQGTQGTGDPGVGRCRLLIHILAHYSLETGLEKASPGRRTERGVSFAPSLFPPPVLKKRLRLHFCPCRGRAFTVILRQ